MSALWAAVLAGGAVACLLGLPRPGGVRLEQVHRAGSSSSDPGPPGREPSAPAPSGLGGSALSGGGGSRGGPCPAGRAGPRPTVPQPSGWAARAWQAVVALSGLAAMGAVAPAGVVPGLLVLIGVAAGLRVQRSRAEAAARRLERSRAVEACGALAQELRAGRAPADALLAAAELAHGPSRTSLLAAARAAHLGGDAAAALRPGNDTAVPEVLRALGACWNVCSASGSGLAAAVERLEEGLRADRAQRRAVDAELAGPRATAGLLAVLPAAGLLLAAGLGADPLPVLLSTPIGLVCLVAGLLLDAAGLWWTARLVARAGGSA